MKGEQDQMLFNFLLTSEEKEHAEQDHHHPDNDHQQGDADRISAVPHELRPVDLLFALVFCRG